MSRRIAFLCLKTRPLAGLLLGAGVLAATSGAPAPVAAAPTLVHQKVSLGPDARQATVAVEPGGRVWITYLNLRTAGVLEVLRRETNGAWQMDSVQAVNPGAGVPSLVLAATGSPVIAYSTCCDYEIGLVTRSGGAWSIEYPTVSAARLFGRFPSLALTGGSEPRILFGDGFAVALATKTGSTWTGETVDPGNGAHFPFAPRLDLGSDNSRQALYLLNHPTLGGPLRFAAGAPTPWTVDLLPAVQTQASFDLALDALNRPHIAYVASGASGVWYGKKNPGWSYESVDSAGTGGVAFAFGPGEVPHVVYRKNGALWLGRRGAGGWTREALTLPPALEVHHEPDFMYDGAGKMHLVYSEEQASGDWHLVYAGEGGTVAVEPRQARGAEELTLAAPWPNPSRGSLTLRLTLTRAEAIALEIVNPAGRRVAERSAQPLSAGEHVIPWSAHGLVPGLYFVRARGASGARAAQAFVVVR